MSAMLTTIALELFKALVTKKFFARFMCMGFWKIANMSETDFDDRLVDSVAEAWGVDPKEYK